MYYRIIHCDSEWKKTDINETEYLKGLVLMKFTTMKILLILK